MQQMDLAAEKILIVIDQDRHLVGTLSDGDIRRFILKNSGLKGKIKECYNKYPVFFSDGDDYAKAKQLMIQKKIETIPVVDKDHKLIDLLIWSHLFIIQWQPNACNSNRLPCGDYGRRQRGKIGTLYPHPSQTPYSDRRKTYT